MKTKLAAAMLCAAVSLLWGWHTTVQAPTAVPQTETASYRVVKAYQGRVAVFLPQSDTPETVYDTAIGSLPAEMQRALQKGVEVTDTSTLKTLLDELLS